MFTKRHEQELAEIKGLTQELSRRFDEILEGLKSIQEAQDALLARDREPASGGRDGGRERPDAAREASEPAGGRKRGRRRQSAAPVAVAAESKARKSPERSGSDGARAGKRAGGAGRRKRQPAERAARPSADEA